MKTNKTSLNEKIDLILKTQKNILENEKKILGNEKKILGNEEEVLIEEKEINKEELTKLKEEDLDLKNEKEVLNEISKIETKFKKGIVPSPIKTIGKRDIFKGFIGAFLGVMGHFVFIYAGEISKNISILNTTILYIVAFIIIILMLYYTGFRKVEKHLILKFMPIRALVLYLISIITILFVNLLYGKFEYLTNFISIYKLVGSSIILAVIGAGTADLIGDNK